MSRPFRFHRANGVAHWVVAIDSVPYKRWDGCNLEQSRRNPVKTFTASPADVPDLCPKCKEALEKAE